MLGHSRPCTAEESVRCFGFGHTRSAGDRFARQDLQARATFRKVRQEEAVPHGLPRRSGCETAWTEGLPTIGPIPEGHVRLRAEASISRHHSYKAPTGVRLQ
jgi:hypothetical protein